MTSAVRSHSLRRMPRARWVRRTAPFALAVAVHALVLAAPIGATREAAAQAAKPGGKTVPTLILRGSELFDDQQYEESIQTLSAALVRPGTSTADKIEVYRLLAYNYITLKRTEEADAAVRGILVLDEAFKLPATESPRFRDFFDATRAKWEAEGKPGKTEQGRAPDAEKPVRMLHSSAAQVEPGTTIKLTGSIDDPGVRVRSVQLLYRTGATGKFITVNGAYSMGQFRAQIPVGAVKPPLVEYYIEAVDKAGLPVASRGDVATPLRIVVPEPRGGGVLASPWFWIPVGALVVGGAVATAIILTQSGDTSRVTVRVTE